MRPACNIFDDTIGFIKLLAEGTRSVLDAVYLFSDRVDDAFELDY